MAEKTTGEYTNALSQNEDVLALSRNEGQITRSGENIYTSLTIDRSDPHVYDYVVSSGSATNDVNNETYPNASICDVTAKVKANIPCKLLFLVFGVFAVSVLTSTICGIIVYHVIENQDSPAVPVQTTSVDTANEIKSMKDQLLSETKNLTDYLTAVDRRLGNLEKTNHIHETTAATRGSCSAGWIPFGGSCYHFVKTPLYRNVSVELCKLGSSKLVDINGDKENSFVKSVLSTMGSMFVNNLTSVARIDRVSPYTTSW